MKRTVYYLGNPLVKMDSLPIKLIKKLKKEFPDIDFVHLDPTEDFPLPETEKKQPTVLIDTVIGTDKVTLYKSLNHWTLSPRISVHDYDLPLQLGLLVKLKKIKNPVVIGVPPEGNIKQATLDLIKLLTNLFQP